MMEQEKKSIQKSVGIKPAKEAIYIHTKVKLNYSDLFVLGTP